ncbi:MAG: polymer-forming cytoskeletal protein [Deltaproteobacteria bacterium]|nr:polymer-forming cytoskeletal protein [Deltaproteobacteria bacterium]
MADKETVIGVETRVSGEIRGGEDLVVKGRVDGKIQLSHALTVEKGAVVQADVDVRSLVVSGTLVGNTVASESVRLLASARVVGDLASPRLIMEAGAAYRGRVDMGDIEAARAAVASRAAAKPAVGRTEVARESLAPSRVPPRVAAPPKTAVLAAKAAPRFVAPAGGEKSGETGPASPPAFPRVAGAVGAVAPPWAKKKVRRR